MRPITFPKTGDGEWMNSETGVQIARLYPNGLARYEVRMPMLNLVGWQHGSYRENLTAARQTAALAVKVFRSELAAAYVAACREDAERMARAEDDRLIHWWSSEIGRLATCGVDVLHTPYTYGSPEVAEVTCRACLLES